MPNPFRIVDGFVDLDAGVVVRASGVRALTPAEAVALAALREGRGQAVSEARLAARIWEQPEPTPGASHTSATSGELEPLLWSLSRKLAPARDLLIRAAEGVRLDTPPEPLPVTRRMLALVHGLQAVPEDPEVMVLEQGPTDVLLGARTPAPLMRILTAIDPETPVRAALDAVAWAPGGREVALGAARARLARLLTHDVRVAMSAEVARQVDVEVRRVGSWRRTPVDPVEDCFGLDGAGLGHVLPLVRSTPRPLLVGREDELEACWAALGAGAVMVVVHGPAGSGRSTLLEDIIAEAPLRLGPGWTVRSVHLAGAVDAGSVQLRLAQALGVPADDAASGIRRVLRETPRLLLVVDDLDEASEEARKALVDLRALASSCAIVASSRRPLRVSGALQVQLHPLHPDRAVELLHDLTRGLPDWAGVEADDPVFDELIGVVGRWPLALRTAAARAELLGPDLLLASLSEPGRDEVVVQTLRRLASPTLAALDRLCVTAEPWGLADLDRAWADLDLDLQSVLRQLVSSGVVTIGTDEVLRELRLRVPRTVRELRRGELSPAQVDAVLLARASGRAAQAGRDVDLLEAGGRERGALRRLRSARADLWRVADLPEHPHHQDALRGLLVLWELGIETGRGVLDRVEALPASERSPTWEVERSRLMCDVGQHQEARELAEAILPSVSLDEAVGELAHLQALDMRHDAEARAARAGLARTLMDAPRADRLHRLPEVLDHLIVTGFFADVVEIAERHASLAAGRGARWRSAQLALQGFRARAALGRLRPQDLRAARREIRVLHDHGDTRRAASGMQWLARGLTACGDPRSALVLLERVRGWLDAHAVWAVSHVVRLDRARAHGLLGELDEARAALEEFEVRRETGPSLPESVTAFDRALIGVLAGDPEVVDAAVQTIGPAAGTHSRLGRMLGAVADHLAGRPMRLLDPGRSPGERLLARVLAAWEDDEADVESALGLLRRAPEFRSIALIGVTLRVVDRVLERDLAGRAATD